MEKTIQKLGTGPVFLTALSTILGAIMFLRFGYAVGHAGLLGSWLIILLGHLVTVPTAMAIAEIATNRRVEGGGEYYIISRSFGIPIGASIGIALYLSQAISVAFYLIAFAQAFAPVFAWLQDSYGLVITDLRVVSVPSVLLLGILMITRGVNSGAVLLYGIVGVLVSSLILFFLGDKVDPSLTLDWTATVSSPDSFIKVFAIVFPAFTGITAGVGLSGDLKNPGKSIPVGTLLATGIGMVIYLFITWKLAESASPEMLASDQLIMGEISLWGPIIPIGLACATLSSALGSIMVAPRTLQALAQDGIFYSPGVNSFLSRFSKSNHEPVNATFITVLIALVFAMAGDVDFVAQVISMFFMVTYGSLSMISFLEHFTSDPSYRPVFRSRWYISLTGAIASFWLMFQMQPAFAVFSLLLMVVLYLLISRTTPGRGMATIFQGVIFQISRRLQVFIQKADKENPVGHWRPAVVCLARESFDRYDAFDLLRWISYRYGFGTYIHLIPGYLSRATREEAQSTLDRLIRISEISRSNVYFDTMVSPSYTSAVAQVLQLPGISGKENNTLLFEFPKSDEDQLTDIIDNYSMIRATDFDLMILATSPRKFGYRRQIHVWITNGDYKNGSLMILLSYIILGHPDWEHGIIKIFDICSPEIVQEEKERLNGMIQSGRLPISLGNIEIISQSPDVNVKEIINAHSSDADLTLIGFRGEVLKHRKEPEYFTGFESSGNILFVNTETTKEIN